LPALKAVAVAERSQIAGCSAGDKGSLLDPPDYQKLAGPWVGGKDPANVSGG
jgi:hypothetical protein